MNHLHTLTENEIYGLVFADADPYEPRGLRQMLGDDGVMSLLSHPDYSEFSRSFQDWIWSAVDTMAFEVEQEAPNI